MKFLTPVLLINFNRPDHTQKVLEAIRQVKPSELFIFQDGARENHPEDLINCNAVKEVIANGIDWPCNLHTYYSDKNLGCGPGPAAAISWFFEHVDQGIILEDDCIPSTDFYLFCEELLSKYADNKAIGFIGGCNYGYSSSNNSTYSFCSGHHETWGWATWRRTWEIFDYNLCSISKSGFRHIVKKYFPSFKHQEYWMDIFLKVKKDRFNDSCWDYQLYFSMWAHSMFAICPNRNLVSNIGYGDNATHTHNKNSKLLQRPTESIFPIIHPAVIEYDDRIDYYLMRNYIIPYEYGISGFKRIPYRINRLLKHTVGHEGSWIKHK